MIEYTVKVDNDKTEWYLNDERHREDGPAVIWKNGDKKWYLNNKLHRIDGPAIEWWNGTKSWYLNGEEVTEEDVMGKSDKVYTKEDLKNMTIKDFVKIFNNC